MNKYNTLFSNTIIFAIGSFGSRLITFFLVPLYTNVLTATQFGTADLVQTIAILIVPVASLAIHDSVLRFGLSKDANHGTVLLNALIIFFCGTIFVFLMTPLFVYNETLSPWRIYVALMVIVNMMSNIMFAYVKSKDKNKEYSLISIIFTFTLAVLNIVLLVFCKLEVKGYLYANIIAHVVAAGSLWISCHAFQDIHESKFDKELLKQMLAYSTPLIVNNLSWWILNSSDRVMIEWYLSAAALGLYAAASKIPALLSIITAIFSQAWTISSVKDYDTDKDKIFYMNIFKYYSILLTFAAAAIMLILKDFMKIYVGPEFVSSWKYIPFLLLGTVFYSYSAFFGAIYGAAKKNISVAITTFIAAIINIVINIILIPRLGIMGAVISTAIAYTAIGLFRMIDSQRFFAFQINYLKFAVNALIILTQSILLTMDWYGYVISIACIIVLVLINRKDIYDLILYLKIMFKKEKNKIS
jgi:O-antigen/teichoic acid export membrane protein